MVKTKVCIFTGSRAEYGLLFPLIGALMKDKAFQVRLLVSGTHASKEFGNTHRQITEDGFSIDALVKIMTGDDSPQGVARAMGTGLDKFTRILTKWRPGMVVILGDRFEALAMAISAMLARVPIVHLYGGEATYGLIDEAIRHSITKMSHLHFTSTEAYRSRVIQLGENPKRVFNVGALGVDNIHQLKLLSREELERKMCCLLKERNLLITFHPVTLHPGASRKQFKILLNELDTLKNTRLIFTKSNPDMEGSGINRLVENYVQGHKDRAVVFSSMGQVNYLSAMKQVDAVIGNSSSGIIEAPSFKVGTINVGDRQAGRVKAASVIDCDPTSADIKRALKQLYSTEFQMKLNTVVNPYGTGGASKRMVNVLKHQHLSGLLIKEFFDIEIIRKK